MVRILMTLATADDHGSIQPVMRSRRCAKVRCATKVWRAGRGRQRVVDVPTVVNLDQRAVVGLEHIVRVGFEHVVDAQHAVIGTTVFKDATVESRTAYEAVLQRDVAESRATGMWPEHDAPVKIH